MHYERRIQKNLHHRRFYLSNPVKSLTLSGTRTRLFTLVVLLLIYRITPSSSNDSVQPRPNDPSLRLRYILPTDLLEYLLINLVGNSSSLYIWDSKVERFVCYGTGEDSKVLVVIQGLDDVTSTS